MHLINKYKSVITVIFTVLVLIVFRLLSPGHFKLDVKKRYEPSVLRIKHHYRDQAGNRFQEKH